MWSDIPGITWAYQMKLGSDENNKSKMLSPQVGSFMGYYHLQYQPIGD